MLRLVSSMLCDSEIVFRLWCRLFSVSSECLNVMLMLCCVVELVRLCCRWLVMRVWLREVSRVFEILRLVLVFLKWIGLILCGIVDELVVLVIGIWVK